MFFLCLSPSVQSPSALRNVFGVHERCTEEKKKMEKKRNVSFPSYQQFTVTTFSEIYQHQNRINSTKNQEQIKLKKENKKLNIEHNN